MEFSHIKWTLLAVVIVLPPSVTMLVHFVRHIRDNPNLGELVSMSSANLDSTIELRKSVMDRLQHFEQLFVAIGSVELGILAYIGGVTLGTVPDIQRPQLMFGLITSLFACTTMAYLHTWNIYMSYGSFMTRLEIVGLHQGLRPLSDVFYAAINPNIPPLLKPAVLTARGTIEAVAIYPVVVLFVAVFAFGRRLGIDSDIIYGLIVVTIGLAILYILPGLLDFFQWVNYAHQQVGPIPQKGS